MVHLTASLVVLLSLSTAFALPTRMHATRDINISHISKENGTAVTHTIDSKILDPALAKAIEGSDLNINIIGDKKKRATTLVLRSAGIQNSTINLTVIDPKKVKRSALRNGRRAALEARRAANQTKTAKTFDPTTAHHNIHIDASTAGSATGGGIQNSTININLHQSRRRKHVELGDHSVLVDVSSKAVDSEGQAVAGGIEDSTVHVNILPGRSLHKSVGEHSIVIDSSSSTSEDGTTTAGDHSAVVDTSSGTSDDADKKAGIKGSTINLTVVAAKDEPAAPSAEGKKIARRSVAWTKVINRKSLDASQAEEGDDSTTGEWDEVEIVVKPDVLDDSASTDDAKDASPIVFLEPKHAHYSRKSTLVRA